MLSYVVSFSLPHCLPARKLTQCLCYYLLFSTLGTYVLLRWQMPIQPSLLTYSCWREVSAPLTTRVTFPPCVEVGWGGEDGCITTYLVYLTVRALSYLCLSSSSAWQCVSIRYHADSQPFQHFLQKCNREITYKHTHTFTLLGSVFSLSYYSTIVTPDLLWNDKQMTSMHALVRVCHCHGSWWQQRDLGRYRLFPLFVYRLCSEIKWWLIISRSTSRLCYFDVFILSCHCNVYCLYPSLSVLLYPVAGMLQVSSSDLSTALTSDIQFFKGIDSQAFIITWYHLVPLLQRHICLLIRCSNLTCLQAAGCLWPVLRWL